MNPQHPYGYGPPPQGPSPYGSQPHGAQPYGAQPYGAQPPYGAAPHDGVYAPPAHDGARGSGDVPCQKCGAHIATRRVHLRQNIGLLVTRLVSRAEGYLCKACIREIGFRYTLVTLFFGWWGVISFFVSLYTVPSNIWQIFSARDLPEVPGRPRPTGLYVLMLLVGAFLGLFTALLLFGLIGSSMEERNKDLGGTILASVVVLAICGLPAALLLVSSLRGLLARPA